VWAGEVVEDKIVVVVQLVEGEVDLDGKIIFQSFPVNLILLLSELVVPVHLQVITRQLDLVEQAIS
jgi:hypothetical protein